MTVPSVAFLFFKVDWAGYGPALGRAALMTVEYTVASFAGAIALGFLLAVMRISRSAALRVPARIYTELFKNIPPLVPIFVLYFGLPAAGITLSTYEAGTLSLIVFYASYLAEIFRGALNGVGFEQREAAQALGLNGSTTLFSVILPQAGRLALPATGTMLVDLLKTTSLLVTIAGAELMSEAQLITSDTFRPLEVYVVIGAIYFALCYPLSQGVLALEKALHRGAALSPSRRRRLRVVMTRAAIT